MPVADTFDPALKEAFVAKLEALEANLMEKKLYDAYRGCSHCRLCDQVNGNKEFSLGKWVWPDGYMHYIKDHNVKPSDAFYKFVIES